MDDRFSFESRRKITPPLWEPDKQCSMYADDGFLSAGLACNAVKTRERVASSRSSKFSANAMSFPSGKSTANSSSVARKIEKSAFSAPSMTWMFSMTTDRCGGSPVLNCSVQADDREKGRADESRQDDTGQISAAVVDGHEVAYEPRPEQKRNVRRDQESAQIDQKFECSRSSANSVSVCRLPFLAHGFFVPCGRRSCLPIKSSCAAFCAAR